MHTKIIFFDNECQLCDIVIRKVIIYDKKSIFAFSSLRSNYAINHLPIQYTQNFDTYVIVINGQIFTRGGAVRIMLKELDLRIIYFFSRLIPLKILDLSYDIIGKLRFRIFGRNKNSICNIIDDEIRKRILF
jgi:predicted DCC family thiol-disulfide oxidoreductase YuxK